MLHSPAARAADPDNFWRVAFQRAWAGNVAYLAVVLRSEIRLSPRTSDWLRHFLSNTRFSDLEENEIPESDIQRLRAAFSSSKEVAQGERDDFASFLFNVLVGRDRDGRPKNPPWQREPRPRNVPLHAALEEYRTRRESYPGLAHDLIAEVAEKHRGEIPLPDFIRKMKNRLGMNRGAKCARKISAS